MNPMVRVPLSPADGMLQRVALIANARQIYTQLLGRPARSIEEQLHLIEHTVAASTPLCVFQNDTYVVDVFRDGDFIHLDIRRHDQQPCTSWSDMQEIKNQIVGPEHEAIELFPAESRLVDMANQYHLYVHVDPAFRFPVGFKHRCVLDQTSGTRDSAAA